MKPLILCIVLTLALFAGIAQTTTQKGSSRPNDQKQKPVIHKTTVSKFSASKNTSTQPITTKDRIERRLRDSANKSSTNATAADTAPETTVINGIRVSPPGAIPTTPSGSGIASTANRTDTANSQKVANANEPVLYPGTVLQKSGTGVNNSVTGNKPVSGEQSQYNTTDINRSQLNVINQNQNASSAQNTTVTNWNQSNVVGENQWGQNQVGENQWTPPPSVISTGFGRDFPAIRNATWTTDNNKNYIARYKNGDYWATSSYNVAGIRLETRTEIPTSGTLPGPVIIYKGKLTPPTEFNRISRVERPGKDELYEVRLGTGKIVYLNSDGVEVVF